MPPSNGQLPDSVLAPIAQGRLRKDAAAGWNSMNVAARKLGLELLPTGSMSSYRTLAQQKLLYANYLAGGNLAATPGTSNHGWGLAVDVATPQMRAMVDRIGAKYGFSKSWSDAPSEWWHLLYQSGHYSGPDPGPKGKRVTRGALKENPPPGRMVSFDGTTTIHDGPYCGHCSAPSVMRDGKQIGVYVDDQTPDRRHWVDVALEHHPAPQSVFVGIAPGESGFSHPARPPRLIRLKEHLPWGWADGPGQPITPWRDFGPVPDCGEGNGVILQYWWKGPYGKTMPSKVCKETITRQANKHHPAWRFKI